MTKVVLEFPISSCLLAVVSDMFLCSLRMFRNMTRECAKVSGSDTPGMAAHAGNSQAEHYDRGVFPRRVDRSSVDKTRSLEGQHFKEA